MQTFEDVLPRLLRRNCQMKNTQYIMYVWTEALQRGGMGSGPVWVSELEMQTLLDTRYKDATLAQSDEEQTEL